MMKMFGTRMTSTWRCLLLRYVSLEAQFNVPLTNRSLKGARLRSGKRDTLDIDGSEGGDDDDDDEEEDEEIEEEINVETPLDNIDPYIRFKAALAGAF